MLLQMVSMRIQNYHTLLNSCKIAADYHDESYESESDECHENTGQEQNELTSSHLSKGEFKLAMSWAERCLPTS